MVLVRNFARSPTRTSISLPRSSTDVNSILEFALTGSINSHDPSESYRREISDRMDLKAVFQAIYLLGPVDFGSFYEVLDFYQDSSQ